MSNQSKRNLTANGGNVRRSQQQQPLKGDQLLCKCLEKGQEILRKVEELTVNPIRIRTVSRVSAHYQQPGATTPATPSTTSSVMTQTHSTTAGGGGGGGGPKNNHAPVTTMGSSVGGKGGGPSHPVSGDGRGSGAGERKHHPSTGAGVVTKPAGGLMTTTGATGSGRTTSSNRVALTDSKRLSATKPSDSASTTPATSIGRLCVKGSPRLTSSGASGAGGKSWPKPPALTTAPAPLKSPALVKQNKNCSHSAKSLSSTDASAVLPRPVSSPLITVDGNDSSKAKALSTGTLITAVRRPSLTPPTISLTVTDGSGCCPPLVITAPQPTPNPLIMTSSTASTKDSYHESDWSEDSGRMSNENLELFGGEPEKPPGVVGGNTTVPGKLNESLLGIFENSSSNGGTLDTGVVDSGSAPARWNRSIGGIGVPVRKKSSKGAGDQPTITINGDARVEGEKVFFRSGVLGALEAKRDDLLSDRVIQLQAHCRGYLARRRLARRRLQELAVKCIQRNVRAFLKVRDWPWWRLLVRVTPLLAVHRTEEQLKAATVELQQVRAKLEKIEAERNELKATNHKLEARLSDITSELTEEHSSSNLITERLAAETSERLRLEKEVKDYESKYRNLQESSEKMEMELLCAKSELNCDFDDCSTLGDYDGDGTDRDGLALGGVDGEVAKSYRLRYERVARELEFTKKRLQTQHEHDLEQLVGLKKQLEKKLSDAYEEVEEQRQVVAQWKRKAQKMTNEMNDLRMLYEEQNSRNNLLEKRQRKFDAECQTLQDSARQEKQAKERITREKDVLMAEKCKLEQTVSDIRLELELKEEKNAALQQELDEMAFGGGTEEEIAQLKRQKMELDRRCKEQDEELDEMAGQIQLLEQAKLRLEMSLETSRKEARKEAQQRDDEMEEIRGASYKKIKSLECQLEQEHEERTQLLRDKHELERKLASLEDQDRAERAAEEAMVQRLKRDARKYRALLRDAQSQLDRAKGDSASKALVRQLRNQLEDAESARVGALKARQVLEGELQDAQMLLEETQRARNEAEDKATMAQRDRTELQAQIDENEEEMAELMKKYSATVKQLSSEQSLIAEFELRVSELEGEKKSLKEQVVELATRLESVETIGEPSNSMAFKRLELRTKELESRLEFEQATRARIEIQLNRHKDSLEKLQGELMQARNRESQAQDALKKAQKTIRELRDELSTLANRDQEGLLKRKELEKRIETAESETASARADLRLALQRIADLQQAMEEEGDSYQSDSDTTDSSSSMDSFHESTVTRKSPSVGSGDHFGTVNGGSSRGSIGSLASSTRDGRKESNNPRIRPSLIGSVRRKKRLPPTIKEEDESYLADDQTTTTGTSLPKSQTPDLLSSLANGQTTNNATQSANSPDTEHGESVAAACRRMSESSMMLREEPTPVAQEQSCSAPPAGSNGSSSEQCEFPFDIDTLKSIKEKIHSLNQIIRDESHDTSSEIDLVDLKNLKNQIHEFKKAIECSRSRSMDKLINNGGSALSAGIITTSASTGAASSTKPL
ncbi:unconventional myosin-XVIIIa isoform X5 [Anopheles stephensi]|uniref:unconventional myosin-XVIIIa isoform X5 n=1 Tax=Anopheles stephensi TaxID=30069 RepID=UPI0016589EDF|nr:unconventional myosin-XVIIIa isoform X5 [Anopheles stephensi]XP_035893050.1 unconventional myosin-XVIIIa isoform X5 [Anopheles stephensi]XP_035893051.1 unconventional myosin-XVIIIa isoform X5 [Anopheles stephensi]XP_035893052.1 unconventional myosin-XVIIIa isoform X5 [Anopheles stephensi]